MDTLPLNPFGSSNIEAEGVPAPLAAHKKLSPVGDLGFPPTLPIELALRVAPPEEIMAAYGLSEEDQFALSLNPLFVQAIRSATEALKVEGASFRFKAKLQAEEMLKTSWRLVNDPECPASVRADLIKSTVKWADYEPEKKVSGQASNVPPLNIQINLG